MLQLSSCYMYMFSKIMEVNLCKDKLTKEHAVTPINDTQPV